MVWAYPLKKTIPTKMLQACVWFDTFVLTDKMRHRLPTLGVLKGRLLNFQVYL